MAAESLEPRLVLAEDFGDAPDTGAGTGAGNYETLLAENGPRHTIVAGLRLGAFVGGEADANQNATATGDDIGADDEDGVASPLSELRFATGSQPFVTVSATNTTGSDATLYGWIDTNNNGLFDNATERASVVVPSGTTGGLFSLTFPTITSTFTGTTFARFRLSTDAAAANPTGAAANGEVEDYAVSITRPTTGVVKIIGGSTKIDDNTTNGPVLADQDQFGNSLTRIGDIDGDGVTDLAVGAHQDDTVASNTGAVHILRMNADGSVKGTTKIASGTGGGPTLVDGDVFGISVAALGDIDGDGIGDLAVGSSGVDVGATRAGAVYVLRLNSDGTVKSGGITQIASGTNGGPSLPVIAQFGRSVAAIGDINGDGVGDLAVGAFGEDSYVGAVYVLLMNSNGTASSFTRIASGVNGGPTLASNSRFGISLASLGDIDGDETGDVAIGIRGAVYVARLNTDGTVKSHTLLSNPTLGISSSVSPALATAGDLDGNGVTDLLVGSDDNESVYSLFLHADGTLAGTVRIGSGINGGPSVSGTNFGTSVSSLGDFDGDGVVDLLVGARGDDTGGQDRGAVYILRLDAGMFDYGDAPDNTAGTGVGNYATTLADNGPRHIIGPGLSLGNAVDSESAPTPNARANGDDIGSDDEDGVQSPLTDLQFTIGTQPTVTLRASNATGTAATLYGWVDTNNNGVFDNATERASASVPTGTTNGSFTLTFPTVPPGFTGTTYARFRLSTDSAAAVATGTVFNGEVEDYASTIVAPSNGKAKLNGVTKIANNLNGGPSLGNQERFGSAATSLGDLDGDGIGDIAVGAAFAESPNFRGAVYIHFLNADGTVKATTRIGDGTNGGPSLVNFEYFGSTLANLGDIDGDGVTDLAVGANGFGGGGLNRGAVYILRLNTDGTVKSGGITKIAEGLNGGPTLANFAFFGSAVANLGDLDGDGVTDLAVGAALESTEGTSRGAVYILRLNADGSVKTGGTTRIASGVNGGPTLTDRSNFGSSVASLGDFDGDGIVDLAVGAPGDGTGATDTGAVHLLRLNADGTVKTGGLTQIASATNGGPTLAARDQFGSSVANAGDIDGDGITDLLIGAVGDDTGGNLAGAVYVARLNADGTVKTGGLTKIASGLNGGPALQNYHNFGSSAANFGDFDGDGITDVLVGASGDQGGGSNRGAVYILRLDVLASPTALGLSANTIAENQPIGTAIGTFSTTDANPFDTFTYTLVTGTGDTDNGSFQIVGNELRSNTVFNFATKSSYAIRVRTTDDGGLSFERTFTINVREPRSFVVTTNTDVVNDLDGLTSLREAITYANSDPDTNTITFGDGTSAGGTNFTDATPDTILLTGGELAITTSLTITGNGAANTIIDGGWDGVVGSATGSRIIVINDGTATQQAVAITDVTLQKAKTGLGNISFNGGAISNSERLTLTDSVVRDNLANEGVAILNTGSVISSRNTFTGNSGARGTVFNQTGEFVSTGDTFDHNLLSDFGGGIYNFAALTLINSTIADNSALDGGGGVFSNGTFNSINTSIANNSAAQGGGVYVLFSTWNANNTIVAGNTGGDVFLNGMSTIVADRLLVGDNTLSGTGITNSVTYAAIFGTNVLANNGGPTQTIALAAGSVAINAGSNALALDANSQPLTTDQRGTGFARTLGGIVDIGAYERANSAPTSATLTVQSVAENAGANAVVGALAGVDPDPNDALTLSLPAGLTDNALFNISGGNLRANASFNFEVKSSYTVTVRVTDVDGLSFDQQLTITVTDVNEAPTAVALQNTTTSLPENTSTVSAIKLADIVVTDDALGTNVLSLSGADAAVFEIVGTALRLKSGTVLNFETKSSYSVTVNVNDAAVGSTPDALANFTLTITDVNEAPTAVALQNTTTSLPENTSTASAIKLADIVVTDDALGTNVLSLSGADAAVFEIVGTALRLKSGTVLNFETKSSYSVTVNVNDAAVGATPDATANFTLTVTNTNDAPLLNNSGSPFVILGVGARQSLTMQQGVLVSDLLARGAGGDPVADEDSAALEGIALTAIDRTYGTFQYTLVTSGPSESDWIDVEAAGAVSATNALLLPTSARLRFKTALVPHHEAGPQFLALESKLDTGLTFRAWDRTSGVAGGRANTSTNGGTTAFSTAVETSRVYFETRLWRHYNRIAGVNVDTLQAEFDEIQRLANLFNPDAFEDRSTDSYTGFSVLMSAVPELSTIPVFRLYFGVQFNSDGTETDMGYRYLTTNLAEVEELELNGPADKRAERAGTYFREIGINSGTGIIGYIYSVQQPGTSAVTQIYRTDLVNKPTRPGGTPEGGAPTSFRRQESGDHVYTTNIPFESARTGTWRTEALRGFARELSSNTSATSTPVPATAASTRPATPRAALSYTAIVAPTVTFASLGSTPLSGPWSSTSDVSTNGLLLSAGQLREGSPATSHLDVGLIAPPATTPPTEAAHPANNQPETTPPTPLHLSPNTDPAATDNLFTTLGTSATDLCPW